MEESQPLEEGSQGDFSLLEGLPEKLSQEVLQKSEKDQQRLMVLKGELEMIEAEERSMLQDYALLEKSLEEKIEELRAEKKQCGFFQVIKKIKLQKAIEDAVVTKEVRLQNQRKNLARIAQEKKHIQSFF